MRKSGKTGIPVLAAIVIVLALVVMWLGNMADRPLTRVDHTEEVQEAAIHLDVWTFFDMNTPDSYYLDLWKELGEEYGYDINIQTYSTQQIKDKLKIAAAQKSLPDIFLVWGGTYPDYLFEANVCTPVQDALEQSSADFLTSYTKPWKDGNQYIIPCLPEAYAVTYVNNRLMKQIGLDVPETWDELTDLVEKVNQYNLEHGTNYAAMELGDRDSWLGELLFDQIAYRTDPDLWDRLQSGETGFDDPLFREAAKKVRILEDSGAFPDDFIETGEVEAVENFIDGEAVLFPHQSTIIYYLMKNMGEDTFSVIPFPDCSEDGIEDYRGYLMDINHTSRPGLCVCSYSKHPDEAMALCVDFAERVNEVNVSRYGYINITSREISVPANLPDPVRELRMMLQNEKKSVAYPYALLPQDKANQFRTMTKKFYAGEYDIDQLLAEGSRIISE